MEIKSQNPIGNIQQDVETVSRISIVPALLEVICRTTGMGFAAIARVTEDKWIACGVRDEILFGLEPGGELKLETTICNEIRQHREPVVIDHVANDEVFRSHATPLLYRFQSYISIPIFRKDGSFFGTLCAIDPKPARLNNPETIGMFKLFADLISFHLNAQEELSVTEARLLEEQKMAELREQFIAILGHDLRNPLGAVMMAGELLSGLSPDEETLHIAGIIKNSSHRMAGLIENILDFARGRLGDGIVLHRRETETLATTLEQIITELQSIWPNRVIETQFDLNEPVNCDTDRIAQLFSNLLGNAIMHGGAGTPIIVNASSRKEAFNLSVTNYGNPIPVAALDRLFQPFYRGEGKSLKNGLGLGLFIASEIARAHGGTLTVISAGDRTCFALQIPFIPQVSTDSKALVKNA